MTASPRLAYPDDTRLASDSEIAVARTATSEPQSLRARLFNVFDGARDVDGTNLAYFECITAGATEALLAWADANGLRVANEDKVVSGYLCPKYRMRFGASQIVVHGDSKPADDVPAYITSLREGGLL